MSIKFKKQLAMIIFTKNGRIYYIGFIEECKLYLYILRPKYLFHWNVNISMILLHRYRVVRLQMLNEWNLLKMAQRKVYVTIIMNVFTTASELQ